MSTDGGIDRCSPPLRRSGTPARPGAPRDRHPPSPRSPHRHDGAVEPAGWSPTRRTRSRARARGEDEAVDTHGLDQQPRAERLFDMGQGRVFSLVGRYGDHSQIELLPGDGRDAQQCVGVVPEPREPAADHLADALRDARSGSVGLGEMTEDLDGEEGIAVRRRRDFAPCEISAAFRSRPANPAARSATAASSRPTRAIRSTLGSVRRSTSTRE